MLVLLWFFRCMWLGCCSVFLVLLCLTVVALVVLVLRSFAASAFWFGLYSLRLCVLLFALGVCVGLCGRGFRLRL